MQDGRSAPTFRSRVPVPGRCGNPLPKGVAGQGRTAVPCGQPIAEIASETVRAYPRLVASQALVNTAIEGAPPDAVLNGLHTALARPQREDERVRDDARLRVFKLRPQSLVAVQAFLDQLQAEWNTQLRSFKRHVEAKKR